MMSIRNWIKKHKTALLVSASAAGVGYICYRAIKTHFTSIQEREAHAYMLRQAELRMEAQLEHHFQSVQQISDNGTLPSILPNLRKAILDQIDLLSLRKKLEQGKESPHTLSSEEKRELWEELKILSFTLTITSMWALLLLILIVRVQLNILARHVYIHTARDISNTDSMDPKGGFSRFFQQKYLTFAEFLPSIGLELLISDSKLAVKHVLSNKSLREPCTLNDLQEIFESIVRSLAGNKLSWLPYILPENNVLPDELSVECEVEEILSKDSKEKMEILLQETRDILDSKEFKEVLISTSGVILNRIIEDFNEMYQGREEAGIPLVKLVPQVANMGVLLLEEGDENRFIQLLTSLPQLQSFCAAVYSHS